MTLETMSLWAEVFGASAVIGAIVFGYVQIRQFRIQRQDLSAIELVRSFQDDLLPRGYRMMHVLPAGLSAEEFRGLEDEYSEVAMAVAMRYETIGLLVYRGIVPIDIVNELVGGVCLVIWERMKNWIFAMREEVGHPALMEWFEWLAIQLEDYRRDADVPAYELYRDWKPKSLS